MLCRDVFLTKYDFFFLSEHFWRKETFNSPVSLVSLSGMGWSFRHDLLYFYYTFTNSALCLLSTHFLARVVS